jgi:SanA protein
LKPLTKYSILIVLLFLTVFFLSNILMIMSTKKQVYDDIEKIPFHEVGLVLGTSSRTMSGIDNPYFTTRIDRAVDLYKSKKVAHLIVSGDNETVYYNEPVKMQEALMARGVAEEDITLDYAGFRTLDSIVRCKEVFGVTSVTIITQKFHGYRALYISNFNDLDAVVMTTEPVTEHGSVNVHIREYLARFKALLDLYVLHTAPKFLGAKENLSL